MNIGFGFLILRPTSYVSHLTEHANHMGNRLTSNGTCELYGQSSHVHTSYGLQLRERNERYCNKSRGQALGGGGVWIK